MRSSLIILVILAVCGALYLGSAVLIPVALAVYGAVLLIPLVERLTGLGFTRLAASATVMVLLGAGLAALVNVTLQPAREWIDRAPRVLREVERKLRPLKQAAVQIDKVTAHAGRLTGEGGSPGSAAPSSGARGVLSKTLTVLVPAGGVFFMIFFLLACGPPILYRIAQGRPDDAGARRLLVTVERVRREMSRYLGTLALINMGLGVATAGLALLFELPNPLLWGVMAGVFNFVPYVGSATTLVILSVVTLLTHDLHHALGMAAAYLALDMLEGQLIQPLTVGQRLSLNPLAIFLALWLGAGLWGVAGMLLATPMLLTVRIVCRRLPRCRTLNDFLAPMSSRPLITRARSWRRRRRRARSAPLNSASAP